MKTLKKCTKHTKNDLKKVLKCHYLEFNYYTLYNILSTTIIKLFIVI